MIGVCKRIDGQSKSGFGELPGTAADEGQRGGLFIGARWLKRPSVR